MANNAGMEPDSTEAEQATCVCGAPAEVVVRLAGKASQCSHCGSMVQEQVEVPICAPHNNARLDGRLDGRMLLAAMSVKDHPDEVQMFLTTSDAAYADVQRIIGADGSSVTGFEVRPLDTKGVTSAAD